MKQNIVVAGTVSRVALKVVRKQRAEKGRDQDQNIPTQVTPY